MLPPDLHSNHPVELTHMKRSIYLLFLSLPLLYSCDKNEDREPKTTFKFKVDGGWGPIEMGVSGSLENTDTGAIIERAPITEGNHYVLRAKDYPFDTGSIPVGTTENK